MLTLATFEEAAKKVKEVTQETKLIYSHHFSKETGNEVKARKHAAYWRL